MSKFEESLVTFYKGPGGVRAIYLVIRENPLVENPLLPRPHWASGVQTILQNLQQSLSLD